MATARRKAPRLKTGSERSPGVQPFGGDFSFPMKSAAKLSDCFYAFADGKPLRTFPAIALDRPNSRAITHALSRGAARRPRKPGARSR